MDFLPKEIEDYSERFTTPENEVLHELTRHTFTKVLQPRMLAGHLQGRFISMLSHMIKPKTVLEIGTYTGYSALCWAEGLVEGGTVNSKPRLMHFMRKRKNRM
jgi:caffeoyl-CoA O-methyltransferase